MTGQSGQLARGARGTAPEPRDTGGGAPMRFARTKIQAPRFRGDLIERSDLERRLGDALRGHRLVLLVAPAGFGKTAALSRQLALLAEDHVAIWMTADEQDDLPRFLLCLME